MRRASNKEGPQTIQGKWGWGGRKGGLWERWDVSRRRVENTLCIYLSERLERAIGERLHLIELAHVRWDSQNVAFAEFGNQGFGCLIELMRVDIGEYDF